MAPTLFKRNYNYSNDDGFETYRIIIIAISIVILLISICSSIAVYRARTKMVQRRQALGCHCYDGLSPCCTPWWYWALTRCHCEHAALPKDNGVPPYAYQGTQLPTYQQSQEQPQFPAKPSGVYGLSERV